MKFFRYMVFSVMLMGQLWSQTMDSSVVAEFDSDLLRLKVPEAFQKSSLKIEVFSDSSWQVYQGTEVLSFEAALDILGLSDQLKQYRAHQEREEALMQAFRSRRIFSLVTGVGSATYLAFLYRKLWIYHIPGYVGLAVAGVRYMESRRLEIEALREAYFLASLVSPSEIRRRIDDYNFRLYQYLSNAGIQFRAE